MSADKRGERYLPLSPHVFQILLSVLHEPRHPYAIMKDIEARTNGEMLLGTSTVYAAINRLVREELLRDVDDPGDQPSGGPSRRYYGLTELGLDVARAEGLRIGRLHRFVQESDLLQDPWVRAPETGS